MTIATKTPKNANFGLTSCAQCHDLLHQDEALVKVVHVGRGTQQEHFCSRNCHHSWYINQLNTVGM